jgi:hypothetical protein
MSANPASQAGLPIRLPIAWATRRTSRVGIRPSARFSRISPVLKAEVVSSASGIPA